MQIIEAKNQIVSIISLIDNDNKILICKRPTGKLFEKLWEFPGGKVKSFETPEDAIIREAKEEININLKINCIAPLTFSTCSIKKLNLLILLFITRKWDLEPTCRYHTELRWVNVNELTNFPMPPANRYFISSLQDLLL